MIHNNEAAGCHDVIDVSCGAVAYFIQKRLTQTVVSTKGEVIPVHSMKDIVGAEVLSSPNGSTAPWGA